MLTIPLVVSLATAWGPKHGGINAFNAELLRFLGVTPERAFELICVVLEADADECSDAARDHVDLLTLEQSGQDFAGDAATLIVEMLKRRTDVANRHCLWIGHDTKSGPLALQLRDLVPESRTVLIHHMAFGAYQDFKKGSGASAKQKRDEQRAMFSKADLCFGVGPMLVDQLRDLLSSEPTPPPIERLIPGLAEPDPEKVSLSECPPANFTAFVAGRLSGEDDRIKQGELAVRGYGAAVKRSFAGTTAHSIRCSPTLRMLGVPEASHKHVRQSLREAAEREINCDLREFTEDRIEYFRDLASSSVAMMPSWHEGFGLTAWEAIACQIPVVIGEQSGVYRLLHGDLQGIGLDRSVRSVAVAGWPGGDGTPNHTEQDVLAVANALYDLGSNIESVKKSAAQLPLLLKRLGCTWRICADDFIRIACHHLTITLLAKESAVPKKTIDHPPLQTDVPVFLLPPSARAWQHDAAFSPSALLVARDQVVQFDHERDQSVEDILQWVNATQSPLAFRLLVGPAGMGKTRTALETLRRAADTGWNRLWLDSELPTNWSEKWTDWWNANRTRRNLLIVDYAEGRQDQLLQLLTPVIHRLREDGAGTLRILMLTRSSGWWQALPKHSSCTQDTASLLNEQSLASVEQVLPPWQNSLPVREKTYSFALSDYAAALGQADPSHPYSPNLADIPFERPLYLHLAALAALRGERPQHAQALVGSQLLREWHYWRQSQGSDVEYNDWADALAWVSLVQGSPTHAAQQNFAALGIRGARLAVRLAHVYSAGQGRIAALQPDLLAEALLRERLAGDRGADLLSTALAQDPQNSAISLEVLGRLAEQYVAGEDSPLWQVVLRDGLASAWPQQSQLLINAAHAFGNGFSIALYEAWNALAESIQNQLALPLRLPNQSTTLIGMSVSITRAMLRTAQPGAMRASALNNLANRLANQGDVLSRQEALNCAREALQIYRELANDQPAVYLPALAMSLSNLANHLAVQGDMSSRKEALSSSRKATQIYRKLANDHPSVHQPNLAMALNNLANAISEQGDALSREEALSCARESVEIYRAAAWFVDSSHLHYLAGSLSTMAMRLFEQGDALSRQEAIACSRESVEIRRKLATGQPAAYLPDLASSLHNLAINLAQQGDALSRQEAVEYARESVEIRRKLTATHAAYLPDLAKSLNNLATRLADQGDASLFQEALDWARESAQIYRELVITQPFAYLTDLAMSLNNLANRLADLGDASLRGEALACAREVIVIYRGLAETQPAAYLHGLATALDNLAAELSWKGDAFSLHEAISYAREATQINRELIKIQKNFYLPYLAKSLNNLASHLAALGDMPSHQEAIVYSREVISIRRKLVKTQPSAYLADLAEALRNLAVHLDRQGSLSSRNEAISCEREAIRIYRKLVKTQPSAYRPYLAMSLNNLANYLADCGDTPALREALDRGREACQIFRELIKTQRSAYLPNLGKALHNLASHLAKHDGAEACQEALNLARESSQIYRELAETQPSAYLANLARSLDNLANRLVDQGGAITRQEALTYAREAANIFRELTKTQRSAYLPDLAQALNTLANRLAEGSEEASHQEALASTNEVVQIYRDLAETQPDKYRSSLAGSLGNLANRLSAGGATTHQAALACAHEAVYIYRDLLKVQPIKYLPDLARSLSNLASHLSAQNETSSHQLGLNYDREAVGIYRKLAKTKPATYLPNLAGSLNNLAIHLANQGDALARREALSCAREAAAIFAACYANFPAAFESNLGITLATLKQIAEMLSMDGDEEIRKIMQVRGASNTGK